MERAKHDLFHFEAHVWLKAANSSGKFPVCVANECILWNGRLSLYPYSSCEILDVSWAPCNPNVQGYKEIGLPACMSHIMHSWIAYKHSRWLAVNTGVWIVEGSLLLSNIASYGQLILTNVTVPVAVWYCYVIAHNQFTYIEERNNEPLWH